MTKKTIIIVAIFVVITVGILLFYKKKEVAAAAEKAIDESKDKLEALQNFNDSLFTDTSKTDVVINEAMTAEEKAMAQAEKEAQQKDANELALLKQKYFALYNTIAPSYATRAQLQSAITEKENYNNLISEYIQKSGDTDVSDNGFVNVSDVQLAITAYETLEAQRKTNAINAWDAWKIKLNAMLSSYHQRAKAGAFTTVIPDYFPLNNISMRDAVYCIYAYKNVLGLSISPDKDGTGADYSNRVVMFRTAIKSAIDSGKTIANIDIYGNLN